MTKTAFVQTVNVVIPPMVPIIAGVVTFLSYILTKNDLTATQVRDIFVGKNQRTIFLSRNDCKGNHLSFVTS